MLCTAHIAKTGKPCKAHAIHGGTVCTAHGAKAPQVKAAAAKRLAETRIRELAERELAKTGQVVAPEVDPLDVLSGTLNELVHLKGRLGGLVDRLSDDSLRYEGKTGEQLRAELGVYRGLLSDVVKTAEVIVKLGIAERKQQVEEAELAVVAAVIRQVFLDVGLSPEQTTMANQYTAAYLASAANAQFAVRQDARTHNPGDRQRFIRR